MDTSSSSSDGFDSAEGSPAKSRPKSAKSMRVKIKVKRHRSLSKTSLRSSSPSSATSLTDDEQVVKQYYRVKSQEQPHKQKIKMKRRRNLTIASDVSIESNGKRTQAETIFPEGQQEEKEPADRDKSVVDGATPKGEGVLQEEVKSGSANTSPTPGLTEAIGTRNSHSHIDRANHQTERLMDKFGILLAVLLVAVIGIALTAFMRA